MTTYQETHGVGCGVDSLWPRYLLGVRQDPEMTIDEELVRIKRNKMGDRMTPAIDFTSILSFHFSYIFHVLPGYLFRFGLLQ
jgi:hypothetical protein